MFNTIKRKFTVMDTLLYKGEIRCYQIEKNGNRGWFENHNYRIGDKVTEYYKKTTFQNRIKLSLIEK